MREIYWIDVPLFDELTPKNVIKEMKLKENEGLWKSLLDLCPELSHKEEPKDRDFFFNVLNTIIPHCATSMVYNANMN